MQSKAFFSSSLCRRRALIKILLIMKFTVIILLVSVLQVSATGFGQTITYSGKNVTLPNVFNAIEKQTGYVFFFPISSMREAKLVTLKVKDSPLEEVLKICFKKQPFTYVIKGQTIVLSAVKPSIVVVEDIPQLKDVPLLAEVRGRVINENGAPLEGVTVKVKSSNKATNTAADGTFRLELGPDENILIFSYVGMETQEIKLKGSNNIQVQLKPINFALTDVVVVGYGTQQRKDITGAIVSFSLEKSPVKDIPVVNLLQSLQGKIPGLSIGQVTSAGGQPGIEIRGTNSISAGNSPLIVLDGVIFEGGINEINPNDVASIDVLKDASAAAIYGSRSANGVIIISTKRGKSEKPLVTLNTYYGFQNWTQKPDMRMGEDFIQWRRDNRSLRGVTDLSVENILEAKELAAYKEGHQIDWIDEVTQRAPIQNYQASISGANNGMHYYISGGFMDQHGVIDNDNFKKYSVMAKFDHKATKWFSYGLNVYYTTQDFSGASPSLYNANYNTPYSYKFLKGYDNVLDRYPTPVNGTLSNPYWGSNQNGEPGYYDDDMDKRFSIAGIGFLSVDFPFLKGLNYRMNVTKRRNFADFGVFHNEFGLVNTEIVDEILNPDKFLNRAYGSRNTTTNNQWLVDNLLNYTRTFSGAHNLNVLAGYSRDYRNTEGVNTSASDFSQAGTTILGFRGLHLADPTRKSISNNFSEVKDVAYIGRLNYNFKSKYYFTANFRRDGYSAFAPGYKFGNFPGASVAWVLTEESFLQPVSQVLNYLKLRASYGQNGNQAINAYSTIANVGTGNTVFGSTTIPYTYPSTMSNSTLSWETTKALNFGMDFTILNSRLSGTFDYYTGSTTNQLLNRALPIFTGYNSVRTNIGEVENKGLDISLNSVNIKSGTGLNWETSVNFNINRNKIKSLTGKDANNDGIEDDDIGNSWFIGKSLGAVYDFTMDGIVQTSDAAYISTYGFKPGDVKFKDISGPDGKPDGKIDANDRSVIGYRLPGFRTNIANTFSYKDFQLYFDFNIVAGGGKNNYYIDDNNVGRNPGAISPNVANWLNKPYWMTDHSNNEFPRPNYTNPFGYGFYQSRSFARLQNATLSYTLPNELIQKLKIEGARFYLSGRNLWTSTKWIGLDPETGGTIGGSTPAFSTVTLGLDFKF